MHPLSWRELQLIEAYRRMTPDQRELINRAMGITSTQQPKQDDREILRRHRKEQRF